MSHRASLGRVLDDLGATLLSVLAGDVDPRRGVGGVVIHDPLDPQPVPTDALVLGVGLGGPSGAAEVVALLSQPDVAAVVVRTPFDVTAEVAAAAAGAPLLGLVRGASWAQVASLLRSLVADEDVGGPGDDGEVLAGFAAGDLFAVANAVSALVGAPVTIEDRSSRVLAFSGGQDATDSSRIETILGRQVPERFRRLLEERGVFRDLYAADDPVVVVDLPGAQLSRVAVRVRAGDEILGSVWAAVDGTLSPERTQALRESTTLVALHMLRARAGSDVGRRLRSDLVSTVLEGGRGAGEAASRLGITGSLIVLALGLRPARGAAASVDAEASDEADFHRASSAFAMHLTAVHPRSAAAPVGGVVYGLLPVPADPGEAVRRARVIATEFVERLGDRLAVVVGIGRVVADRTGLPRSRADADRALRVLREGQVRAQVAHADDVHVDALLLDLGDLMDRDGRDLVGPVARLRDYDLAHHSEMVETLRAWLDAFGDVTQASAMVHVHPNTFRYRLKRLAEVGEMDLTDPDVRFAALLQLRLTRLGLT